MCKVCKKLKNSTTDVTTVFLEIEKAIKKGADPEHFENLLNVVLGTEMPERDEDLEAAWEDKRGRKET